MIRWTDHNVELVIEIHFHVLNAKNWKRLRAYNRKRGGKKWLKNCWAFRSSWKLAWCFIFVYSIWIYILSFSFPVPCSTYWWLLSVASASAVIVTQLHRLKTSDKTNEHIIWAKSFSLRLRSLHHKFYNSMHDI